MSVAPGGDLVSVDTIASECISEHGKHACEELGGTCITERDGYYTMSAVCVLVGALTLLVWIGRTAKHLQGEKEWLTRCSFIETHSTRYRTSDRKVAAEQCVGVE